MKLLGFMEGWSHFCNFISHYVQMKLPAQKAGAWCYDAFISHYVQMKHWSRFGKPSEWIIFISHYVQMKQLRNDEVIPVLWLYIPLRSDETISAYGYFGPHATLYPTTFRWNFLIERHLLSSFPTLYPTTFRWNDIRIWIFRSPCNFISHYVQMKLPHRTASPFLLSNFISHYVQMKPFPAGASHTPIRLYIPLRSDETLKMVTTGKTFGTFISHYVQMKLCKAALLAVMDGALYPTTFRWNILSELGINQYFLALYPTTFRWNAARSTNATT